jgi:RNA polymerase sigma-70 factor, ECF subfamily
MTRALDATRPTDDGADLERFRGELTGYCYRMLGSAFDAEDAVQETLVRAWRAFDRFDGRSAVRTWLYRIATNVCVDLGKARGRRALPMDFSAASSADAAVGDPLSGRTWVEPVPDGRVLPPVEQDPADQVATRDSVRLAFVAALQHLPARQRAALILRDVLRWSAAEVAELLDSSTAGINSALQRSRSTLAERGISADAGPPADAAGQDALLARYVAAFERFDLDALTGLLHLDVTLSMAPYATWLHGPAELRRWWSGQGEGCQGSMLCRTTANGTAAFGQYRPGGVPWALQVVEVADGRISGINSFLDTGRLFPLFDLPLRVSA